MLFDYQNEFRDSEVPALRKGNTSGLGAGYADLFRKWESMNSHYSYMFDDEFYTQSFSNFLEDEIKSKIYYQISQKKLSGKEKRKLKLLAAKGGVLLASQNGGVDFDTLITLDQIKDKSKENKLRALDYTILSPTFYSAHEDLRTVYDQQMAMHMAVKLSNSNFSIKDVQIDEEHVVHFDVVPLDGIVAVEMETDQPTEQQVEYTYIKAGGEKQKIVESPMANDYGQAEMDPSLVMPTEEELTIKTNLDLALDTDDNLANAVNATNAIVAANAVLTGLDQAEKREVQLPVSNQELNFSGAQMTDLTNVMQAKAETAARTDRNNMSNQREFELQKQIRDGYQNSLENYAKDKREAKQKMSVGEKKKKSGAKSLAIKAAVGAGATGVLAGGGGIVTLIVRTATNTSETAAMIINALIS
jgi:hypothetical protein